MINSVKGLILNVELAVINRQCSVFNLIANSLMRDSRFNHSHLHVIFYSSLNQHLFFDRHSLVKTTLPELEELDDDLFIKYLIVFKKWLAIEEVPEDKQLIRNAFIAQFKPKDSLS